MSMILKCIASSASSYVIWLHIGLENEVLECKCHCVIWTKWETFPADTFCLKALFLVRSYTKSKQLADNSIFRLENSKWPFAATFWDEMAFWPLWNYFLDVFQVYSFVYKTNEVMPAAVSNKSPPLDGAPRTFPPFVENVWNGTCWTVAL